MRVPKDVQPLAPDAAARLGGFARACKAAARAVALYPESHPAIGISLARLAQSVERLTAGGAVTLGVTPDNLLMDGFAPERPEAAIRETAELLHGHLIAVLRVNASAEADGWLPFLLLLARPPDDIRTSGGIGRLWAATGRRHLEIQEIDYADMLRERAAGRDARWDDIIRSCLDPGAELDEDTFKLLAEVCGDPSRFAEFAQLLEQRAGEAGGDPQSQAAALVRMLRGVIDIISRTDPAKLEPILRTITDTVAKLNPELLMELLSGQTERAEAAADLVLQIAGRMTDGNVAGFVGKAVIAKGGATTRLAQAFQTLVPEPDRRRRVIDMAEVQVAQSSMGQRDNFMELWKNTTEMLQSYSDKSFVSEEYARELSSARTQALEVERVSDDPPERIGAWVSSVGPVELRALDLRLLLDLLAIEPDAGKWADVAVPAVGHIEDLLLVGDFEGALQLVEALRAEITNQTPRKPAASAAFKRLVQGSMMWHLTSHLRTVDDRAVEHITRVCYAVGPSVIPSLAEALSVEKRTATRQRLTQLLLGFGAAGRQSVERLRGSANPAVRRTAIYLLREFGGSEALPDLTALLGDAEPNIQREAVRAILNIGSDEAFSVLERALISGTDHTREALMRALVTSRDERTAPLFEYILRHTDRRGPLRGVYIQAIQALGALRAGQAVGVLTDALYRSEWWAPFRTAELRRAVASALHQIGSPEALQVLQEAEARGPRGVRAAVRASAPHH